MDAGSPRGEDVGILKKEDEDCYFLFCPKFHMLLVDCFNKFNIFIEFLIPKASPGGFLEGICGSP